MFIQLYESTKISKGHTKSIIWDTQNGFLQGIPNNFFDLLCNRYENYAELKSEFDDDDKETIDEYLNFITENNLGFIVYSKDELDCFRNSADFHETPTIVDYLIVDINSADSFYNFIVKEILEIEIKYLQIRICNNLETLELEVILKKLELFNSSSINEISIVLPYDNTLYKGIFERTFHINLDKYLNFVFYDAEKEDFQDLGSVFITTIQKKLIIPISCGFIKFKNFNVNRNFCLESLHHNSCLHKKIAIDADGNIRNCPAMPQNFGNIKGTTLEEALAHPDLKKYWSLTKDHIEVCKDCEFRYICTDCRAYTERTHINAEGLDTSKPLKCGYNPYTGEWEEWSTNPLKQKAIKYYGMQELAKQNEA